MKIILSLNKNSKKLLSYLDTLYHYYMENKETELISNMLIDHILIATYISFHEVPFPQLNKVYIHKSTIEGLGVFAKENISKGEIVSMYPSDTVRIYKGNIYYEACSDRTTNTNNEKYAYKTEQCVILGDPQFTKDMNLVGHIVNDSCQTDGLLENNIKYGLETMLKQNCVYYPYHIFVLIVASKDINKDEELLVSYGVDYWTTINK